MKEGRTRLQGLIPEAEANSEQSSHPLARIDYRRRRGDSERKPNQLANLIIGGKGAIVSEGAVAGGVDNLNAGGDREPSGWSQATPDNRKQGATVKQAGDR